MLAYIFSKPLNAAGVAFCKSTAPTLASPCDKISLIADVATLRIFHVEFKIYSLKALMVAAMNFMIAS